MLSEGAKMLIGGYSLYELFLQFLFWGVAGWLVEVVDMKIEAGEFQNRGFLHVPLCPLYGIGMPVLCILLGDAKKSYLAIFIGGVVFCTVVEYLIGWLLEKLFNARWWDYSHMRFNFQGRICLRNAILFGFGAMLSLGVVQPVLEGTIHRIPGQIGMAVITVVALALVIDVAASTFRALRYRREHRDGETFVIFKSHR